MKAKLNMQEVALSWLKPADYNPRLDLKPGDPEYEKIKRSIEEFTLVDPIVANQDGTIISGHQRYKVLRDLGYTHADVSLVDLDKEHEMALNVAMNKTGGDWDPHKLARLIGKIDLAGLDATLTGFDSGAVKDMIGKVNTDWFDREEKDGNQRQEDNAEYNDFLDKFEIKKTTDDCYTPDNVYEAVADWVEDEFEVNRDKFVRPFYPGGDYTTEEYKKGCVVVDNPPFSILSQIIRFYCEKGISFFLFAPSLTLCTATDCDITYIAAGAQITYENGADVSTGFITNMDAVNRFRTAPTLWEKIKVANDENLRKLHKELPNYTYPDNVVTPATAMKWSHYGEDFRVNKNECIIISELDAQKEKGKAIFGKGFLLSEKAAAEKAAAEKWLLSDREWAIVKSLGGGSNG